ncbi:MAG: fibronectin type III domain-containing protein [Bacilli bacterium]|nr:fibronectin type III domain-containing protein [Bacilli bacterium]
MKNIKYSVLFIMCFFVSIAIVNAAKINASEVTIYALDDNYKEKVSIPSNYKQSFQIKVSDNENKPTYSTDYFKEVEVSDTGLITPSKKTWYCNSSYCSTSKMQDYTSTRSEYSFGTFNVYVRVDGKTYTIKVNVVNYAVTYSQNVMKDYIKKNITSDMTEYQKMQKIAEFVASYPYGYSTSYVGFILGNGADCIGSSNTIVWMANQVGIKAHIRYAVKDAGAGNNHHNVAAMLDGKLYIIEAGYYQTTTPRPYYIFGTENAWSVDSYGKYEVYQYDGYDKVVSTPVKYNGITSTPTNYESVATLALYYGLHDDSNIQTVNVTKNITSLGDGAFAKVSTLKNINVDSNNPSFKSIDGILYTKNGKTLVTYPAGKTAKKYSVASNISELGAYAFSSNNNLTNVVLPNGLVTIGFAAFEGSRNLVSVNIPESVKKIDDWAFASTKIDKLVIPKSVESVGKYSFYSPYNKFSSVTFLNDKTKIDENAKLTSVNVIYGYKGSTAEKYAKANNITFKDISDSYKISNATIKGIEDKTYKGKGIKQSVTVEIDGVQLTENKDYTITYENNKNVGTSKIIIKGKGNYKGSVTKTFKIKAKKISKTDISINLDNKEYTGKKIKPKATIKDNKTKLKAKVDYTITYKDNKKVGTASIEIKGIGNYKGSVTKTFYIIPNTTTLKKLKSEKKGFTAKWTEQTTLTTGYQIEYSLNKNFKSYTKVFVKPNTTTKETIKKLKANKKYYVRIRTYKTINGKKYYSVWSNIKKVTTKK